MSEKIRVAVFDEHPLFRGGVVKAIERNRGMVVVAEGSLAGIMQLSSSIPIDILIFGTRGGDLGNAREMISSRKDLRVVILTASENEEHLSDALRAGAAGYILKGINAAELLNALEAIHQGTRYITPALAVKIVVAKLQPLAPQEVSDDGAKNSIELSHREREVLGHLALGRSRMEIAQEMGVSITAVKHYTTNLFRKFRVRNRLEAISAGRRLNFV